MSRLPRVTAREAMAALRRAGFVLDHTRGSHHYWRRPDGAMATVPAHAGETLKPKTLRSILRQAGLTPGEFVSLL
jgi:predicted RNA binding protein YcfA (HicA-like mRNA interferase family)